MSASLAWLLALLGLGAPHAATYQGYAEGEYVLVAPQIAGTLQTLLTTRGAQVHTGDTLFALEHEAESAALEQAKAQAARAEATLADLTKAKRPPEREALQAQREQARAAFQLASLTYERDVKLLRVNAISQATLDSDKAALNQSRARLTETKAALATGELSTGRDDAIHAAEADVAASRAALAEAQWKLDQKLVIAPADALVFDTLYRAGEYIPQGQGVVSLLPPGNIKARFFAPEPKLATLTVGTKVTLYSDGLAAPLAAHISYIAPQAEFTPPELYNRDNRERLLYLIEATPDATPDQLHPGQPVDVTVLPTPQAP